MTLETTKHEKVGQWVILKFLGLWSDKCERCPLSREPKWSIDIIREVIRIS